MCGISMSLKAASSLRLDLQYFAGRGLAWGGMGALDRYVGRNNRLNLSPSNILEKYLYLFAISVLRNFVLSRAKNIFFRAGLRYHY
jgi:hypothetical protein